MLLVVIGHRRKVEVSKARVEEILGLDASSSLDELLRQAQTCELYASLRNVGSTE